MKLTSKPLLCDEAPFASIKNVRPYFEFVTFISIPRAAKSSYSRFLLHPWFVRNLMTLLLTNSSEMTVVLGIFTFHISADQLHSQEACSLSLKQEQFFIYKK